MLALLGKMTFFPNHQESSTNHTPENRLQPSHFTFQVNYIIFPSKKAYQTILAMVVAFRIYQLIIISNNLC
ncbi:hypothetical protein C7I86_17500 (plasmid) [Synechocystis sp. IPPAS B-1465]|nr:hypothetical protein C7I86_17500 [Synechocystis sp. IPPAS B-1465]